MTSHPTLTITPTRIEKAAPSAAKLPITDSVIKGQYDLTAQADCEVVSVQVSISLIYTPNGGEEHPCMLAAETFDEDQQIIGAQLQFPHALQAGETIDYGFCMTRIDIMRGVEALKIADASQAIAAGELSIRIRITAKTDDGVDSTTTVPVALVDTTSSKEKTYEMMWDCPYCGSTKLLGKTHRHCPSCGAPQDASKRYFPPDDERVAVEDHQFVGVDWNCPSCDTPNSAAGEFCSSCGCGKDGSKPVQLVDNTPEPTPPPAQSSGSGGWVLKAIIGAVVLFFLFLIVNSLWKTEGSVSVAGHTWERSITVEVFKTTDGRDWRDQVPNKAYQLDCQMEERSTKQVPDGQDCKIVKKDNGDGTYKEKEECKTKYKDVPVKDERCRYKLDTWTKRNTETAKGSDLNPKWPEVQVKTCTLERLGCERQGAKNETYTVQLTDAEGEAHTCDLSETRWKNLTVGAETKAMFSLTGIDCSSLEP